MKWLFSVLMSVLLTLSARAQIRYYPSTYMRVLGESGDTLVNAYTGGLLSPMYSNIDLNHDGLKDLLVFDKADNTLMTFLAVKKGSAIYHYAPQYLKYFPRAYGWIYLIDYNKDGLPDIFMHGGAYPRENTYMRIYKNVSTSDSVKFKLVHDPVLVKTTGTGSAFYATRVELPLFMDIDGDGDIDVLNFDYVSSNTILYIKNISVERHPNNAHRLDSIEFKLESPCWGIFREESFNHSYFTMTAGCDSSMISKAPLKLDTITVRSSAHSGSSLFAWDMDGDGDLDLAVGDVGFDSMTVLQNMRINGSVKKRYDSLIINKNDRFFPPNNIHKLSMMDMPLPSPVDIDNDGINDIVVSPVGSNPTFSKASWYYHNKPVNQTDDFGFIQDDFLQNTMLDWGGYAKPAFFDYNNDGRPDLLISALSDKNGRQYTHLVLYENMKAKVNAHPYFQLVSDDYCGISKDTIYGLAPTVGDLDGDGVPDLALGNLFGTITFFKGNYSNGMLDFKLKANMLQYKLSGLNKDIRVVGNSAPCIADIDGDGKNDLLVGQQNNRISYYKYQDIENGLPVFNLVTNTFGNILVPGKYVSNTIPYVADMDKDGKPDLLVGANDGHVHLYTNIRGTTDTLRPSSPIFFNYNANGVLDSSFGYNSAPAAALLDDDALPDIVIGTDRGGVYLMCTKDEGYKLPTEGIDERNIIPSLAIHVQVYPNPASGSFIFQYSGNTENFRGKIVISDITGREMMQRPVKLYPGNGFEDINIANLSSGMYFVALYNYGSALVSTTKIVIKN